MNIPKTKNAESTSMLHNLAHHRPIPHKSLNLFRQRPLHVVILFVRTGQIDIDARAHTSEHFRAQTLSSQVDSRRIDLVEQDGGQCAEDLHLEFRALDDVDGRDEGVDDEGAAGAVVEADGVGLADDADGGLGAAADEDGVGDGRVDLEHLVRVVVILDEPLVAFELFAGRLLRAHAFWFRLLGGDGACGVLRGGSAGTRWDGGAGAEGRVLVGHC